MSSGHPPPHACRPAEARLPQKPSLWLAAILVGAALFALLHPAGAAAAEPVLLEQEIEQPDTLTVGDRFHLVITLEVDAGTSVALAPGSLPPQLTLAQRPVASTRRSGARQVMRIDLELAAFAPGQYSIPPLRLAYREASGATGEVATRPFQLDVVSVLPTVGDLSPRDLKPQVDVPSSGGSSVIALAAAALLVQAAASGIAYWLLRQRRRGRLVPAPLAVAVEEGPEDRARRSLDGAAPAFASGGDYIAYYSIIALTVRNYLTERFGFPAFALTTSELQAQMTGRGVDRWQARLVSGLLTQCDSVVFAFYRPALERADADLTAAYEIVEMVRLQPVPGPEPAAVVVS